MAEKDFASADQMVLATVVGATAEPSDMQALVMKECERVGLTSDWFRESRYQAMWKAVIETWKETHTLDVYHIRKKFDAEQVGFMELFEALMGVTVVTSHIVTYLSELRQRVTYTRFNRLLHETMTELSPNNIGVQIEDFVKKAHGLQESLAISDDSLKQLGDYMEHSVAVKQKLHEERFVRHNWEYLDGLRWPWKEVDQIFTGLKTGLHILAALASQGKSTMAVDLSVFWNETGVKHGFFSIDMAADQLADRYPCVVNRCSLAKLNFGGSGEDVAKFVKGFEKSIRHNNVWISEIDNAKHMEYQCYRGVKTLGWKAIIIDYIQLVHCDDEKTAVEYTRVQHAVQAIKAIAKKLKVPIICLAQLSRAFEKDLREKGFAPGLDAIGDSAEIARAAASVTCLYQDEDMKNYWAENPPTQLAFGDKADKAIACGVVTSADEARQDMAANAAPGTTAEARRRGQVSLAKQLRPCWFDVKKNQQGRCGKIPFVMFPNYFLFRPGNSTGEKTEVMVGGKAKKLPVQMFEQLRDDWTYTEQDWWLEMTNAIPERGCKLMGETIPEMRRRQEREREAHPEVRQFVREYDENGKETGKFHFKEAEA